MTNKISNNAVDTKEGKLILDSHKLSYHYDRVQAWENNERVAPVSVDMALTRACGAMCSFCYAMVQEPQERSTIKVKEALNLLDDFAEIGVKPYVVKYEDLDGDPVVTTRSLMRFLGLRIPAGLKIVAPNKRMADEVTIEWMARYRAMATAENLSIPQQ